MAGRGFAPKPPERRAGHGKDPIPQTTLPFEPGTQPRLPAHTPTGDPWPARTRAWWKMWGETPQAKAGLFSASDWSELMDTAALHARFWTGDAKVAPELRLRVAKFGATLEDRARLRITFAQADEADAKRPQASGSARDRRGTLHALEPKADAG